METPVLVAGAGPTGLVAALTLCQNGIPVRIIEKEQRSRVGQRGAGIMARSLELYNFLGVLGDIQAKALPVVPMRIYKMPEGVEPIKTFRLDEAVPPTPATPYTNILLLGQEHTEAILRAHLQKYGCHVELGTELRSFEQKPDHVTAHIVKRDGDQETTETISCRWLIGADGARGIVRKSLNVAFHGEVRNEKHHLVIGDLKIRGLDHEHWHSWGDMDSIFVTLRPTEDDTFFCFIGGQVDRDKVVADRAELIRVLRVGTGRADIEVGEVKSLTNYKPHLRLADKFFDGRVFIAGDAAHVHSPFGAQGLNSSIQDAFNLSWKLSLVEKGLAKPSLLNTYGEERIPVISEMLKTSNALFNKAAHAKGDGSTSEDAWKRGGALSQLGVNYRWSSIVVDERVHPEDEPLDPYGVHRCDTDIVQAGERAPDAPGLVKIVASLEINIVNTNHRQETTSLFRTFGTSYHTVLLFNHSNGQFGPTTVLLKMCPSWAIRSAIIYPHDSSSCPLVDGINLAFIDRDGHAYTGYAVGRDMTIVIVRPDGVVGGIMWGAEGLKRYLTSVFTALDIDN
ncbi:uncharacterized protein FIBRA_07429 [Fibroporia radiculosa]|uniref:FAD-binding domain-containing protein n=1 Tax=Fibroporia radiculosa TaxID=599839 RepID=J4H4L9_9APHY|nr:uncharacterized protein FIBRA_07429 [Fibroporia radiculosa]CCM05219.1 predicted protein [Fibroporia radiculosa]